VSARHDRWVLALDALEAHVITLHAAPAADEVADFLPPADLGPLPEALAPRASALLAECRTREDDLTDQMARLSNQIERTRHSQQPEQRSESLFLDTSL
jgi:hypothetical protein